MIGSAFLPKDMPGLSSGRAPGILSLQNASGSMNKLQVPLTVGPDFLRVMEDAGATLGKAALKALAPLIEKMGRRDSDDDQQFRNPFNSTNRVASFLNRPTNSRIPMIDTLQDASIGMRSISNLATTFGNASKGMTGIVGSLGSIARIAGPAGAAIASVGQGILKTVEFAERAKAEQRRYAYASPSMAGNYQQADMRQMLRDLRAGESIAGSNKKLLEGIDKLADLLQPIQSAMDVSA
jgi:hypothetical protein